MGAQPTMDDIAKIKAAWDRDIAEWKAKVQRLQAERDDLQRDVWKACADSLRRHHAICDQRDAALDQVEALKVELAWIGAFAQMRSADDSKTFAKVNRGALRTIAEKALAALSAPAEERSSSSASLPAHVADATATEALRSAGLQDAIEEAVSLADIALTYDSVGRQYTHVTNSAEVAGAILGIVSRRLASSTPGRSSSRDLSPSITAVTSGQSHDCDALGHDFMVAPTCAHCGIPYAALASSTLESVKSPTQADVSVVSEPISEARKAAAVAQWTAPAQAEESSARSPMTAADVLEIFKPLPQAEADALAFFIGDPEESSGQAEPWSAIPPAKRFGRRLTADAVPLLKAGTLLRFYSEDPWFEPGERSPTNGEIVRFTGAINNDFPRVGQHLEVATLDGATYPGGGWVYRMFQFVGDAPARSSQPDYEAGFDWKAAWYALDHDAAQLRAQVEALAKERDRLKTELSSLWSTVDGD